MILEFVDMLKTLTFVLVALFLSRVVSLKDIGNSIEHIYDKHIVDIGMQIDRFFFSTSYIRSSLSLFFPSSNFNIIQFAHKLKAALREKIFFKLFVAIHAEHVSELLTLCSPSGRRN